MIARLTTLFGALALLLATIGLYGVTAYGVARRTPEIGIRMALGAERSSVVAMVMRGAIIQTGIGLAIGVPVASSASASSNRSSTRSPARQCRDHDLRHRHSCSRGLHRRDHSRAPRRLHRSGRGACAPNRVLQLEPAATCSS